jgi:hypothetical protein
MAIQFDLVCDCAGCPNPANNEVYPDSQSLLTLNLPLDGLACKFNMIQDSKLGGCVQSVLKKKLSLL